MPIERQVALLTPIFAAVAGALTTGVGSATGIPKKDLVALFIAGATAAAGAALKWLHGRQKFVQFETDAQKLYHTVSTAVLANQQAGPALTDIEAALRSHTDQIVLAIGKSVHAPPSAVEVAQAVLERVARPAPIPPVPVPSSPEVSQ